MSKEKTVMEKIFDAMELSLKAEVPLQLTHAQVKELWDWMNKVSHILRHTAEIEVTDV